MVEKKITSGLLTHIQGILGAKPSQAGLDLDASSLVFVQLRRSADRFSLERFIIEKLSPGVFANEQVKDEAALIKILKTIKKNAHLETARVSIPVAANRVATIKTTVSRRLPDHQKLNYAALELRRSFPENHQDLYYDFILENGGNNAQEGVEDKQNMVLVATQKSHVDDRLKVARLSGWKIRAIDVDACAIARAFPLIASQCSPETLKEHAVIANIDSSGVLLVVMERGELIYYKKEDISDPSLEEQVAQCLTLGEKSGEESTQQGLGEVGKTSIDTLKQMLELLPTAVEGVVLKELILAGRCTLLPRFSTLLQETVMLPVQVANPFAGMAASKDVRSEWIATYASTALLACGLAMRGRSS